MTDRSKNNLVESASHATGSLLIWDTGEYETLPYREKRKVPTTDDELSDDGGESKTDMRSDSERLFSAFQAMHIRLRLHGRRLPPGYAISLRLSKSDDRERQPGRPRRKRRRTEPTKATKQAKTSLSNSGEDVSDEETPETRAGDYTAGEEAAVASDAEEDAAIRANNAYTGASNTVGSVHQRHWFLTLDRTTSGFRKARSGPDGGRWIGPWDPFLVMGRDFERSVVTRRLADDAMADAGVEKFMGRKMWMPITG